MPSVTLIEKPKAATKPWFSCLLRHPVRKQSGSVLGHAHAYLTYLFASDPHGVPSYFLKCKLYCTSYIDVAVCMNDLKNMPRVYIVASHLLSNSNMSISVAQNKLSSVALTAVQTNMSSFFRQKSANKWTQSEGSLANCSTQENQRLQIFVCGAQCWFCSVFVAYSNCI